MTTLHVLRAGYQNLDHVQYLHFPCGILLYYSFQHTIAFFSKDSLYCRDDYWTRRRRGRQVHVTAITRHATAMTGNTQFYVLPEDAYFEKMAEEFESFGISSRPSVTSIGAQRTEGRSKRRLKL